jgi:hypothetical protein
MVNRVDPVTKIRMVILGQVFTTYCETKLRPLGFLYTFTHWFEIGHLQFSYSLFLYNFLTHYFFRCFHCSNLGRVVLVGLF